MMQYNLFMYCNGDPINNTDSNGHLTDAQKVLIGAIALVAAIAFIVATGGSGAVVAAGIAQAVGSVAVSTAVGAGAGYFEGGKDGAISGAADGFMWGSIFAAASGATRFTVGKIATKGSSNRIGQIGAFL